MAKDLDYYLAQARRIAEHREKDAEKELRKLYKSMLKDLQTFMSETYVQYAEEDKLTYGMLQKAGYDARFLEEIEKQLNVSTKKEAKALRKLVEDTYEAAYKQMVEGVSQSGSVTLDETFMESVNITPDQIKRAVENPVSGLTLSDVLEKHRREIIYSIKQTIGVGLMNGDRYTTMAKRIAENLDGDYKKAIRIARTEAHRVIEGGNIDAAMQVEEELKNTKTGMRLVKTWKSMQDERVRPQIRRKRGKKWTTTMGTGANHMKMDGQVRLAEELFDLGNGVTAMAPGLSGDAGNDINCRCYASYEMMTDEEYYKKTGNHFLTQKQIEESYKELLQDAADDWFDYENAAVMKEYSRTGKMPRETIYTQMPLSEEERERLRKEADALQMAAESIQNKNKRVFRGAIYDDVSEFENAYGETYIFDSLTATSPDKSIASIYMNNMDDFDDSVFTKVLFEIENSSGIIGFERDEGETIIPKGAEYKIKRCYYDENYVLHVQLYSTQKLKKKRTGGKKKS